MRRRRRKQVYYVCSECQGKKGVNVFLETVESYQGSIACDMIVSDLRACD